MSRIGSRGTHRDRKPESGPWRIKQLFKTDRVAMTRVVFARDSSGMAYKAMPETRFFSLSEAADLLIDDPYWKNRNRNSWDLDTINAEIAARCDQLAKASRRTVKRDVTAGRKKKR